MGNFYRFDQFSDRHIGPNSGDLAEMLSVIGVSSIDDLIDQTIPSNIRLEKELNIGNPLTETEYLRGLKQTAGRNKSIRSYIGQGYYGTLTPSVVLRNIFENPGWYTQYTPYQAEISQGRLEALLNFQTMVSELTGMPIANASLLDEGTAAAEAMAMLYSQKNKRSKDHYINKLFVDKGVFKQTVDVLISRATPLNIEVIVGDWTSFSPDEDYFAALLQCPSANGGIEDYRNFVSSMKEQEIYTIVAADIMSLALLTPPGEWGVDVVVGTTQRFGIPMGFGGPHAAYFATHDSFKRQLPGRIIGVSIDDEGNKALRMALQTREQHIKREKATSNICTAQALLATMAGMYAVYHGPRGITEIAKRIHRLTALLASHLKNAGLSLASESFFDTLTVNVNEEAMKNVKIQAEVLGVEFYYTDSSIGISLDETVEKIDLADILQCFGLHFDDVNDISNGREYSNLPAGLTRGQDALHHEIFSAHLTETKMMRYIRHLEEMDLSLMHSMIPLGSCTMKLNAATQLIPVSWPEFAHVHPFTAMENVEGYLEVINTLSRDLCEITGFDACSLQPNSGAQGEFAGLSVIREYHIANGDTHRNIALIPSSAHGTNPASAVMVGMKVVVVACDEMGNIDVEDLKAKAAEHSDNLAALMVTYPSTHGVFESAIIDICSTIHEHGGKVYMDGANMNAQVGYTNPGLIKADVCHLNLHKTFSIPHGGGGPGMGPICCNESLAPFLPGHVFFKTGGSKAMAAVSAAPFGSASILLISYAYIKMLGSKGLKDSTAYAILNANYIKSMLEKHYDVLYTGKSGRVAHELIIDLRAFKAGGISAEDIAKRLIDYGFHAPTLSFPVPGTIMIEPTESEDKEELDLFCEAMIQIKKEIDEVIDGSADAEDNVLINAPHTLAEITGDEWTHGYSRDKAAYPLPYLRHRHKFWVKVGRVNNAHGDRNLICTCPPMEAYMEEQ